jgi:cytochrome P450
MELDPWLLLHLLWALPVFGVLFVLVRVFFLQPLYIRSIVLPQLPPNARVAPFRPFSGDQPAILTLKQRPASRVGHGQRVFTFVIESGLAAAFPTKDGKTPGMPLEKLGNLPSTAGRVALGMETVVPMLFTFGPRVRLQIDSPLAARDILVTKARSFEKPVLMSRALSQLLGVSSLLLTEGDTHALHRRLVAQAFQFDKLLEMLPLMRRSAWKTASLLSGKGSIPPEWNHHRISGFDKIKAAVEGDVPIKTDPAWTDVPVVEATQVMSGMTLQIIADSAFSGSFGSDDGVPGHGKTATIAVSALELGFANIETLVGTFPLAMMYPALDVLPRKIRDDFLAQKQLFTDLAMTIITNRRKELASDSRKAHDLLSLLIEASAIGEEDAESARKRATGEDIFGGAASKDTLRRHRADVTTLDDKEILDQCITFVMAGHETTSQLLTWTLYCTCQAPEWQDRLADEARRALKAHSDPDTFPSKEDLDNRLPIAKAVLNEVMRLYPPASLVVRTAVEDVTVGDGLFLPKGADITIPVGAIHRDPAHYPDPDSFDPCRWLDDSTVAELGLERVATTLPPGADPVKVCHKKIARVNPFEFLPFSAGPRNCIGQRFAMLEAHAALAIFAAALEWHLNDGYLHAPSLRITTQPRHGMPIHFKRRE